MSSSTPRPQADELQVGIGKHFNNIRKGYSQHNLSRHLKENHSKNSKGLKLTGIDRVHRHWGTNLTRAISQNETHWIFTLETLKPAGLNVDSDINCFLSNK